MFPRLRDLGDTRLPLGVPWFEARLGRYARLYPSIWTIAFWPITWQGWLLTLALPAIFAVELWFAIAADWDPTTYGWWMVGPPLLIWLFWVGAKTKIIDQRP